MLCWWVRIELTLIVSWGLISENVRKTIWDLEKNNVTDDLVNLFFSVLVSILVNNLSKRSSTDRVIDQTKWKDFPSEPGGQKLLWIIYFFIKYKCFSGDLHLQRPNRVSLFHVISLHKNIFIFKIFMKISIYDILFR